jgi:hypothetical protein
MGIEKFAQMQKKQKEKQIDEDKDKDKETTPRRPLSPNKLSLKKNVNQGSK